VAAVFIEGDIAHPVQAIFDGPMTATQVQQTGWIGLLGAEAGDGVDGFAALFFFEDFGDIALDAQDLADIGEVQIGVELGAGPDVTELQSTVGFIDGRVLRGEKRSN
jgi:hypothetical protein